MRRNATKVAAAVLTLAVTMTSVNIPTTAAAAKKVKLTPAKKTLTVGKTVTLKLKEGTKNVTTKAKFTSSNKKIATVGKKGKVKAKKKGTATITATYKKKKYKCKITVKAKATPKPTTKPTTKPTQAPEPTTAPTQAPTTEPTTAPTQAPSADTVGAITSFKAVKADTFEVVFDKAASSTVNCEITKNGVKQDGEWKFSDDKKSATFTSKAQFSNGEYVITVNTGSGEPLTAKSEVTDRKATSIVLLSNDTDKPALTNPEKEGIKDSEGNIRKANTQAYIYYEVRDQYNEKMDDSTDITWTISSSTSYTTDTSAGRITIQKSKDGYGQSAYTYGDLIHVYGVYSDRSNPIVVEGNVKIGTVQATHEVKAAGFVNDKLEKVEIKDGLPKKFAKDTWYMLYQTYDQNGHLMEPVKYEDDDITIIADALSSFKISVPTENVGGKIYSIGNKKYSSVKVQPSTQTDRGGEVTLTAISKKTGKTSPYKFKIAEAAVLKSIEITGVKEGIIADGDQNRELLYRAIDVNGKETRDYETIVRSSNVLSLAASEGRLEVREDNNGEAVVTWSDTEKSATDFESSSAKDKADRRVALTTVVSGGAGDGETKVSIINVKDTRRPVAFKNIAWGLDENGAIVIGADSNYSMNFLSDKVTYVDQYGNELKGNDARTIAFFDRAMGEGFNKEKYAIRVETDNNTELNLVDSPARETDGRSEYMLYNWKGGISGAEDSNINKRIRKSNNVTFKAFDKETEKSKTLEYNKLVDTVSLTYSIVSVKETELLSGNSLQSGKDFTKVDKEWSNGYSVVPTSAIRDNVSIELDNKTGKYFLYTDNTQNANGTYIKGENGLKDLVTAGENKLVIGGSKLSHPDISITDDKLGIRVKGTTRSGLRCTLPTKYYNLSEQSDIQLNENKNKISAVTSGALTWNQLYDDNDARNKRITANKTLAIEVTTTRLQDQYANTDPGKIKDYMYVKNMVTQKIGISDEIPYPASLDSAYKPDQFVGLGKNLFNVTRTELGFCKPGTVFDQYGEVISQNSLAYTYSVALTKENTDEDKTHLINSFTPYGNGTQGLSVSGIEIGDEFDLTISVAYKAKDYQNLGFTAQPYKLKAPADSAAFILSEDVKGGIDGKEVIRSMNSDKNWREDEIINGGLGMKK